MVVIGRGAGSAVESWVLTNATGVAGTPYWIKLGPTGAPPPTGTYTPVFSGATRNRMVLTDGRSGLWVLDNATGLGGLPRWDQLSPRGPLPPARYGFSTVFDASLDRLLMFGGSMNPQLMNDVWILENASGSAGEPAWRELKPLGTAPAGRFDHTAVFVAAADRMIVHGGLAGGYSAFNDTWLLENASGLGGQARWTLLTSKGRQPLIRGTHSAVHDSAGDGMIVFGGRTNDAPQTGKCSYNDTWLLENASGIGGMPTWVELEPEGPTPVWQCLHTAVYDKVSNRMTAVFPTSDAWVLIGASRRPDPAIVSTHPPDSASNVPTNTSVRVEFNMPMNPMATESALSSSPAIAGAFSWNSDGTAVTWSPSTQLANGTTHAVTVSTAAKSAQGHALPAPFTFSFTTASDAQPVPPRVTRSLPPDGATKVPLNSLISVSFDQAMTQAATEGAFTLSPSAAGTFDWSDGDAKLVYRPSVGLSAGTKYTVGISTAARSARSVALAAPHIFSFESGTSPDTTPPTIAHEPPGTVEEGTPIRIVAAVRDDSSLSTVTLRYRPAGVSLKSLPMVESAGDEWSTEIPGADVKVDRVEYFIEAVDVAANVAVDPGTAPATVHSVAVTAKGSSEPPPPRGIVAGPPVILMLFLVAAAFAWLGLVLLGRRRKRRKATRKGSKARAVRTAAKRRKERRVPRIETVSRPDERDLGPERDLDA